MMSRRIIISLVSVLMAIAWAGGQDGWAIPAPRMSQLTVPILGVTLNKDKRQVGVVTLVNDTTSRHVEIQ